MTDILDFILWIKYSCEGKIWQGETKMLNSTEYCVAKKVMGAVLVVVGPAMLLGSLLGMIAGAGGYDVNGSGILGSFVGGVVVFLAGYFLVAD